MGKNGDDAALWADRRYPIQEDMAFQRKAWRFERIGWWAMFLLVALALLGVFANGPVSSTSRSDPAGRLLVEYERFYREGAAGQMRWRIGTGATDQTTVVLGSGFTDAFTLETVTPAPERMAATAEGVAMRFRHEPGAPLTVSLAVRAETVGAVAYEVGLAGELPVRLSSFVYP